MTAYLILVLAAFVLAALSVIQSPKSPLPWAVLFLAAIALWPQVS